MGEGDETFVSCQINWLKAMAEHKPYPVTALIASNNPLSHWPGQAAARKALEALITPVMEAVWTKRRVLEVYLNVAEFDEGVFGVQAAAGHYFGVDARDLSPLQAARLAAVLPSPKTRSASKPSNFVERRARSIRAGAETIDQDGRAACFQS